MRIKNIYNFLVLDLNFTHFWLCPMGNTENTGFCHALSRDIDMNVCTYESWFLPYTSKYHYPWTPVKIESELSEKEWDGKIWWTRNRFVSRFRIIIHKISLMPVLFGQLQHFSTRSFYASHVLSCKTYNIAYISTQSNFTTFESHRYFNIQYASILIEY